MGKQTAAHCGIFYLALLFLLTNGCQPKVSQPPPQHPPLTLETFEQIYPGMKMEDVEEILGPPQAGNRATSANATMKLVGVSVNESARWTEGSGDSKRQLEIGFNDGKVAAAIYRSGDVTGIKPTVPEGQFRVVAGRHSLHSPTAMRVVVDFGAPESSIVHFGIAKAVEDNERLEIEGLEPITPQGRLEFTISGKLVDEPQQEGKWLEVQLERHDPEATLTRKFAIDDEQELSNVLAVAHHSDLYEVGEPITLGIISGQDGKESRIVLHVIEKAAQ